LELSLGMRDIYPKEARLRKKIRETLCNLFERWGYEEVEPPTIESYEVLSKTIGKEIRERMVQFVNREGKLVCLRPEFTTSVVRMFAKESTEDLPRRVYYAGKIFRYPSSPFRFESELTQIGVENIGANTRASDAEVIALAVSALQAAGMEEFQVDIGHVGIFRYLLSRLPLSEEEKNVVKELLKGKDFVALQGFWEAKKLHTHPVASFFLRFPFLRGKEDIFAAEREHFPDPEWWQILDYLREIFHILRDFGLEKQLFVNLGLIRDFDYYTGVIWEGFSPHLGYPILAGGRYDELFRLFGKNFPACGFALFVERVVEVMQKGGKEECPFIVRLIYPPKWRSRAFQMAEKLRREGLGVVMEEKEGEAFFLTTPEKTLRFSLQESDNLELMVKELRS